MKCVKNIKGEIHRVKNEQAEAHVKSGDWKYIPKSEWKAARAKAVEKKVAAKSTDSSKEKKHRPRNRKERRQSQREASSDKT